MPGGWEGWSLLSWSGGTADKVAWWPHHDTTRRKGKHTTEHVTRPPLELKEKPKVFSPLTQSKLE